VTGHPNPSSCESRAFTRQGNDHTAGTSAADRDEPAARAADRASRVADNIDMCRDSCNRHRAGTSKWLGHKRAGAPRRCSVHSARSVAVFQSARTRALRWLASRATGTFLESSSIRHGRVRPISVRMFLVFVRGVWNARVLVGTPAIGAIIAVAAFIYLGYRMVYWTWKLSEIGEAIRSGR
jgi:hypothetical protein